MAEGRIKKVYEIKDCDYCGESYRPKINVQKYCSENCQIQSRYKVKNCERCGEEFRTKHKSARFCSRKCSSNTVFKADLVTLTCAECGERFERAKSRVRGTVRGNFCSRDCMTKEMRNKGDKHHRWNSKELNCVQCEESFVRQVNQIKRNENHYCSRLCYSHWLSENIKGENNWMYRSAGDNFRGDNWLDVSEMIRERDGYRCQECGIPQKEIKHDVHHIVPARFFDDMDNANKDNNLITLCRSCHGKQKSHFWHVYPRNTNNICEYRGGYNQ